MVLRRRGATKQFTCTSAGGCGGAAARAPPRARACDAGDGAHLERLAVDRVVALAQHLRRGPTPSLAAPHEGPRHAKARQPKGREGRGERKLAGDLIHGPRVLKRDEAEAARAARRTVRHHLRRALHHYIRSHPQSSSFTSAMHGVGTCSRIFLVHNSAPLVIPTGAVKQTWADSDQRVHTWASRTEP
jgi:hypothetical protein